MVIYSHENCHSTHQRPHKASCYTLHNSHYSAAFAIVNSKTYSDNHAKNTPEEYAICCPDIKTRKKTCYHAGCHADHHSRHAGKFFISAHLADCSNQQSIAADCKQKIEAVFCCHVLYKS